MFLGRGLSLILLFWRSAGRAKEGITKALQGNGSSDLPSQGRFGSQGPRSSGHPVPYPILLPPPPIFPRVLSEYFVLNSMFLLCYDTLRPALGNFVISTSVQFLHFLEMTFWLNALTDV